MTFESSPGELLVSCAIPFLSDNIKKQEAKEVFANFCALSRVSKRVSALLNSKDCQTLFVKSLWPKAFYDKTLPCDGRDWKDFIKHGFRVLSNWTKEIPDISYNLLTTKKYQACSENDQALLFSYDSTKKAIVKSTIKSDAPKEKPLVEEIIQLDTLLKAPGAHSRNFIVCSNDIWAINEGESNVSIFYKETGKLICRFEKLDQVYQMEMKDDILYLLIHDQQNQNYLLGYHTKDIIDHGKNSIPEKLNIPANYQITRFFFQGNRICFLESKENEFQLLSLAMTPDIAFKTDETELEWAISGYFAPFSKIVQVDDGFIVCAKHNFNLQRVTFKDDSYVFEELKDSIEVEPTPTQLSELYYHWGKLFIFYSTTNHYNFITFDCESKEIGKGEELPFIVLALGRNNTLAFHTSAERVNFIYPYRQANEQNRSQTTNMAMIDYGVEKAEITKAASKEL